MMSLTIEKNSDGKTTNIKLKGILDISTTNLINPYLEELDDIDTLIIDFSELEFIDSTGIGSILDAIFLSKEQRFKLQFNGVNELTHQVFETIGLYQILEVSQEEVI